jgi:hypothetical protein
MHTSKYSNMEKRGTNLRSQAALEFLTTYSWAILTIMLTVGTLYYFGVFDFGSILPQECIFPKQFECTAFGFVGNEVRFRLVNNIGEKVNVKTFSITNQHPTPLNCNLPPVIDCSDGTSGMPFDWERGVDCDFTFQNCQNGNFVSKERTDAQVKMTYCATETSGCPATSDVDHTISGRIDSKVVSP